MTEQYTSTGNRLNCIFGGYQLYFPKPKLIELYLKAVRVSSIPLKLNLVKERLLTTQATRLRTLLEEPGIMVLPGAHDVLSATIFEQSGFPVVFTSGFGLSAATLGVPDIGLLTMTETLERVHRIVGAVSVPVVADMDTGYGNPLNVIRTVQECVRLDVAGIILEDQVWPKRCGHMEGKSVVPMEEHVEKLRAAVHARGDSDLIIIARTDAIAPVSFEDAIRRGKAYVGAGADVIFIEAPESVQQLEVIVKNFKVPLFANMIEGGKTPFLPSHQLEEIGFKMVVYPLSGLFAATKIIQGVAEHLKQSGSTAGFEHVVNFQEFERVIELARYRDTEQKFTVNKK